MRWKLYLSALALLVLVSTAEAAGQQSSHQYACPQYNYPSQPCERSSLLEGYSPCDPAQRGPEAVKIRSLNECPAPTIWGYDYPYSFAYGTGLPYYVNHNWGAPGEICEYPALYPNGVPEPGIIYGDPENAMLTNFAYSYPFHGPVYSSCVPSPLFDYKSPAMETGAAVPEEGNKPVLGVSKSDLPVLSKYNDNTWSLL